MPPQKSVSYTAIFATMIVYGVIGGLLLPQMVPPRKTLACTCVVDTFSLHPPKHCINYIIQRTYSYILHDIMILLYTYLFLRYKFVFYSKGQFCEYLFSWVLFFVVKNRVHTILLIQMLGVITIL